MAKKKTVELPEWAKSMWEEMGSPKLEGLKSVHNGDLLERRQGLRRDDFVEIHLDVQAFANAEDAYVRGRLMREFSFDDFLQAKAFIDDVSQICESQQHHAELHFGWGYAVVETFSHDTNSITQRDIDLANAINALGV